MARLTWDAAGSRVYEAGVDRGVLYVDDVGFSWSGLQGVDEKNSGGEPRPYYVDGYKYLNVASATEFEATIKALSAPAEFGQCEGIVQVFNGLYVTGQRRKPFGLSYRTKIGNDLKALEYAYKLHIVYNALAQGADRTYETISDDTEPLELSWEVSTTAPKIDGFKPTAHFVIDSRMTPNGVLAEIEDFLYGTDVDEAALPTVEELVAMFS